jgi:predicted adenine nucleotide alpha hydrolase (AANH) superfamily ATPase
MVTRALVHACCGPCAVYPADALTAEGIAPSLYFYNPNIHPYQEHARRLAALREFALRRGLALEVDDEYDPESWFREVVFREANRCAICYRLRLARAARAAKNGGFAAFTTTLLYSKYQKHELIRELAEQVAEEIGVPFLYRDFRVGWDAGRKMSRELNLYRQQYCGCLYSERDRFQGPRGGEARSCN